MVSNDPPVKPSLEVVAVDEKGWRISDNQIPPEDAARILGFIDSTSGKYEVLWIMDPGRIESFDTFPAALTALSEDKSKPFPL